jgi:hypothetical protein
VPRSRKAARKKTKDNQLAEDFLRSYSQTKTVENSWTPLPRFGNWEWSHDGQYIYAYREAENGIFRLRPHDHKVEKVASLRGITPAAGVFGIWFGLATDDTPLVLRGLSSQNIYAFDWTAQ